MPSGRRRLKLVINEISGSLGDLGTFLPLAIGLITVNGVNATSLFLSAGLAYIGAGLFYGLPVPVQPLKATSAIAIAMAVRPDAVSAAAFFMGIIFLVLSAFDLRGFFGKVFPRPVVRGIQLGLGILLIQGGFRAIGKQGGAAAAVTGDAAALAACAITVAGAAILLFSRGSRRYPAALALAGFGILCGLLLRPEGGLAVPGLGWIRPEWGIPAGADLYTVFVVLLLPQIPLTFANSVVATAETSRQLFAEDARKVTIRNLSLSLGVVNLLAGLLGGMPLCHGSGGLSAHYRFGARSGGANLFVGGAFLVLALFLGGSIPGLVGLLPSPILGILLIYVGFKHALLAEDVLDAPREFAVAVCIGAVTLATGNLAVAFAAGIALNAVGGRLLWKDVCRKAAWEETS